MHLDHTTARGGAELALVRLLRAGGDWLPAVLVPAVDEADAFAALPPTVLRRTAGVAQGPGGSAGSPLRLAVLAARLVVQAVATRLNPLVRTCDVVAANSTRAAAYAAVALLGSRTPLVVHLRDMVDEESLGGFGHRVMTRLVLPRADGVIANSHTTLSTARPFLRDDAITAVIPSAAGLTRAAARPPRTGPLRIGMLARIDPWKGQAELLEAFAVACRHGDAELEFAGGAPFEHEDFAARLAARAAELGIADRVRLLGHVDDVPEALARWDVGVQYSTRAEPLGQNVLQYLAAGLVTVVADEGGPREWVTDGENGRRVAPRDPRALAEVLRELVEDAAARERLASAAPGTPGLLDDAAVARAHAEIYREIATRRRMPVKA
ncbi:glycosyltransferase family 4 protein [Microbacterium neungamense]|uniref:glycosyltransferase family 4 protein n=1 Tax=Microbacterium neungamense TaxID=2810535 RepID=UPI00217D1587|nr:glycosyltransferase family 4 protein [Microbacterium neungamense]UWF77899.1 glycosyltransferase family 4 protein [Microbacterium neungamense]